MFQGLAERLQGTFRKLRGRGKLSEEDVNEALREVRLALLEADVNFRVVKAFISRVRERAVGAEVLASITPGQQVVKIVHDELTALMGGEMRQLAVAPKPPTVIMMCGLQGSGKTTSTGKLARHLHKQGRRPLLVAADTQRPAAIEQLQTLAEQLGLPVFSLGVDADPVTIAVQGVAEAQRLGLDTVLIDTAGRLQVDEPLMQELQRIRDAVSPTEILLVVDAMTGQEAVNVASAFHEKLGLTGAILTKLDGDTRGGAALSFREVTGQPIKFVGTGEKLDALEPFHPDRMASRILGMGDVLTLVERAQANVDAEQAERLQKKLQTATFDLDDFLQQLQQMRKMGPLQQLLEMIPGFSGNKMLQNVNVDERQLVAIEAIIQSMTPEERRRPEILNASRRRRIAAGSGTNVQQVNRLLKQFEQTRKMMKQLANQHQGKGRQKGGKQKGRKAGRPYFPGFGNLPFR